MRKAECGDKLHYFYITIKNASIHFRHPVDNARIRPFIDFLDK